MTAVGIHAHPTKKLGTRPASNGPALMFADHLKTIPTAPIKDLAPDLQYPMDHNDEAGDCVVAAVDHALQVIDTSLLGSYTNMTDDQLLALYQTQNPDFKSWADAGTDADQGMDIQTLLAYLVKQGTILGFAKVTPSNEAEMKAAIYLGLAIITGEDLEVAQQTQHVWDYSPSAVWGGHCTCQVGYPGTPDDETCVTWGSLVNMTQRFIKTQMNQAFMVITQAHVDHPSFRAGFDLESFAAAYTAMTGRKFPVNVTPTPGPTPTPVTDPADAALWTATQTWAKAKGLS